MRMPIIGVLLLVVLGTVSLAAHLRVDSLRRGRESATAAVDALPDQPQRRLEPDGATTELHREGAREEVWREVDYELLSRDEFDDELTRSIDVATSLFQYCAAGITDEWLPTRENFVRMSLETWVGQVVDLDLSYVRGLLAGKTYGYDLSGDGTLGERLGTLPTVDDAERVWRRDDTPGIYSQTLFAWHVGSEAELRSVRHFDAVRGELVHVEQIQQRLGELGWFMIFGTPDAYPHWNLLMRVAWAHFQ